MKHFTIISALLITFASSASAFDPDDLEKLWGRNECVACDLRDADLSGADLMDANLMDANLEGAILIEADLTGAILTNADLRGADLKGADLRRADLKGADLTAADLRDANMEPVLVDEFTVFCKTTMPYSEVFNDGC